MCYSYKNKKSQKEKITEKDNQHNNTNNKKLYKNESFEIWYKQQIKTIN